jgi:xanthine/uracil/vitamin C permease (AzgA family)
VIGVIVGTIVAVPMGLTDGELLSGKVPPTWRFWKHFRHYFDWNSATGGAFFACFRGFEFESASSAAVQLFKLTLIDLFDTTGAVTGCIWRYDLVDEHGLPRGYGKIMYVDAIAALVSPLLGITSVSAAIESAIGIVAGGRTGVVPLVVAVMSFLAFFCAPPFAFVPVTVIGGAMIYGGLAMIPAIAFVDFSDLREAVPGWFTMMIIGSSSSIPKGIGFGTLISVIAFIIEWFINLVIWVVRGRGRRANPGLADRNHNLHHHRCIPCAPQEEVGEHALGSIKSDKWWIPVNHTKHFDVIFNFISETMWSLN